MQRSGEKSANGGGDERGFGKGTWEHESRERVVFGPGAAWMQRVQSRHSGEIMEGRQSMTRGGIWRVLGDPVAHGRGNGRQKEEIRKGSIVSSSLA